MFRRIAVAALMALPCTAWSLEKAVESAGPRSIRLAYFQRDNLPAQLGGQSGLHIVGVPEDQAAPLALQLEYSGKDLLYSVATWKDAASQAQLKLLAIGFLLPTRRMASHVLVVPHKKIEHVLKEALAAFTNPEHVDIFILDRPQSNLLEEPYRLAADQGMRVYVETLKRKQPYRMPDGLWKNIRQLAEDNKISLSEGKDGDMEDCRRMVEAILYSVRADENLEETALRFNLHPNGLRDHEKIWTQDGLLGEIFEAADKFPGAYQPIDEMRPNVHRMPETLWKAVKNEFERRGLPLQSRSQRANPRLMLEAFLDKLHGLRNWKEIAKHYGIVRETAQSRLEFWNNSGLIKALFLLAADFFDDAPRLEAISNRTFSRGGIAWGRLDDRDYLEAAFESLGRPPNPGTSGYKLWMSLLLAQTFPAPTEYSPAVTKYLETARAARAAARYPAASEGLWEAAAQTIGHAGLRAGSIPTENDRKAFEAILATMRFHLPVISASRAGVSRPFVAARLKQWNSEGVFQKIREKIPALPPALRAELADVDWSRLPK